MALPQRSASIETTSETSAPPPQLKLLPKPGRPSLFNPERTAAMCAVIEMEGISDSAAGALAGVTSSTLARWKLEHEGFALELERARALFELAQVRAIRQARKRDGMPDWRAIAWLLKHSSPEGYGAVSRMRKVKAEGIPPEQSEAGQAPERAGAARSENCAKLPETPPGEGGGEGGNGRSDADEGACMAGTATENQAKLPETTAGDAPEQQSLGSRLSRRERRAEERRMAKARRVA